MSEKAGIYIHVPFCERLCPYCDFAVDIKVDIPHERYTEAVLEEMASRVDELGQREVATIYFGGGTPSLLRRDCLGRLMEALRSQVEVASDVEVTLEANPNQIDETALQGWRELGIERLSIGCQSFQERHLKRLRRNHDGTQALEAVERALSVMERVSMDLIFAGPSQPMEEWEADLAVMQRLVREEGLDHLSAYNLTIEPGTAFWIHRKRGTLEVPGEEKAADMLRRLVEAAEVVGLERYEVSNFSVPGGQSRHNRAYWRGRPYVGLGPGAHSLELVGRGGARRRANIRRFDDYAKTPRQPAEVEELSAEDHFRERLFLGVRNRFGITWESLYKEYRAQLAPAMLMAVKEELERLVERGVMEQVDGRYCPTDRGLDVSDALGARLFAAADG